MIIRNDPFTRLDRLAEELWRRVAGAGQSATVEVHRDSDGVEISIDLPGVQPDGIDVSVERNLLTVRAERRVRLRGADGRIEERSSTFSREVMLGDSLDSDQAEASFEHGVLTITVPARADVSPRKLDVRVAGGERQSIDTDTRSDTAGAGSSGPGPWGPGASGSGPSGPDASGSGEWGPGTTGSGSASTSIDVETPGDDDVSDRWPADDNDPAWRAGEDGPPAPPVIPDAPADEGPADDITEAEFAHTPPAPPPPTKKTPAKKTPAKKTTAKKSTAKKTAASRSPAKKTPAKKTPVKKTTKKS